MEGVDSSRGICTNKLLKSQRLTMLVSCSGMQRDGEFAGRLMVTHLWTQVHLVYSGAFVNNLGEPGRGAFWEV